MLVDELHANVPECIQKHTIGQQLTAMIHKNAQQLQLRRRKPHRFTGTHDAAKVKINAQPAIVHNQRLLRCTTKQHSQLGQKHLH